MSSPLNYQDVLVQLQTHGLLIDSIEITPGKIQRCRVEGGGVEKRGWYALYTCPLDSGHEMITGAYGIYRGDDPCKLKIEVDKKRFSQSAEQRSALSRRMKEDEARYARQRMEAAKKAADVALKAWEKLSKSGDHEYLQQKGVGAHGVRFSPKSGSIAIPMRDTTGGLWGLQIIRAKNQDGLSKQYWPEGVSVKAHYHALGIISGATIALICEGYATGASLFEATGLPVVVAFDAGNLSPAAHALRERYKQTKFLICADDDALQKCRHCKNPVIITDGPTCPHCCQPHEGKNTGVIQASTAATICHGSWIAPQFTNIAARRDAWCARGRKLTDFNDLSATDGLLAVRQQIEAHIAIQGWQKERAKFDLSDAVGEVESKFHAPIILLDELLERFILIKGRKKSVFDLKDRTIMAEADVQDLCINSKTYKSWREHHDRKICTKEQLGFDPACENKALVCNLWRGWPTHGIAGRCDKLLDLLYYLCSDEEDSGAVYEWLLKWLAYPIQHPGAKMQSAVVMRGPQGAGKSLFFGAIQQIYGEYGLSIDQMVLDSQFNDWISAKLFILAEEVCSFDEMSKQKNLLKNIITGKNIVINPKGLLCYSEENHANIVFLSNELKPVLIEKDDRRHLVVKTPKSLDPSYYHAVAREIESGGIAALHHYLLNLPLGDFGPATRPIMTESKNDLIALCLSSTDEFIEDFMSGGIYGFPGVNAPRLLLPAPTIELYKLYLEWCRRAGHKFPSKLVTFALKLKDEGFIVLNQTKRKRYTDAATGVDVGQTSFVFHSLGHEQPVEGGEKKWLGEMVVRFDDALRAYKLKGGGVPV